MKLYKLTDENGRTRGPNEHGPRTQWGPGVTHSVAGAEARLCAKDVIHCYLGPLSAVLMDPVHGAFGPNARLWRLAQTTNDLVACAGTKGGLHTCTTEEEEVLPTFSVEVRVRTAILLALETMVSDEYRCWAQTWLDGSNRAAMEAAWAARRAAWAAWAARRAAWAAWAAWRDTVAEAAWAAADAAAWSARAEDPIAFALHLEAVIAQAIVDEAALTA